jgi:hypothetical protein
MQQSTNQKMGRFSFYCLLVALTLAVSPSARAGWSGVMNATGTGWASVNVASSTHKTNQVRTITMLNPSAAMIKTNGYAYGTNLPAGASPATVARIKGAAGYVWTSKTLGSNGDSTDDGPIDQLINLKPSDCASVDMDSTANFSPDGQSGLVIVNTTATPGAAILLRGYEFTDGTVPQSEDDFTNANCVLKWSILLVGPFDLNVSNCNAVVIPFTVETSVTNLYFVTDGEAKSKPLQIVCPPDVVVGCGQAVVYPTIYYSACGDVQYSFVPSNNYPFQVGTTPVTITLTDSYGNSTNCTFNVTVVDTVPPLVPTLLTLYGQTSVTVPTPTTLDICGFTTNIVTGYTTDPTNYNSQGTNIVHWSFTDPSGNTALTTQTVIVNDTTPPVPPALTNIIAQCSATVPTPVAMDNVAGNVVGTTSDPTNYTTQGTNTVHWTFTDENGNSSTASQTVIVKDTIPPVKPVLTNLTYGPCSSSPAAPAIPPQPSTTDNCGSPVFGTTSTVFPITNSGTTVVTWTFNDGHGNSTTATQNVTLSSLNFSGFYSPISGTNGSCSAPVRAINAGSNIPIKFDIYCGTTAVTSGTPPEVFIEAYSNKCVEGGTLVNTYATYQNVWHFNWDTTGWSKGVYKVILLLPDQTTRYVFVKLQ